LTICHKNIINLIELVQGEIVFRPKTFFTFYENSFCARGKGGGIMFSREEGFTLIELLVVVAIIAILAAIGLPNFLEAQTRSKVSRVKADLRILKTAIEAYNMDSNYYPWCEADLIAQQSFGQLTTPVAYISVANLKDPFIGMSQDVIYPQYKYCSRDEATLTTFASGRKPLWYLLTSNGPDKTLEEYVTLLDNDNFPEFLNTLYDPTNGTVSRGNIYFSGGQICGAGKLAGIFVARSH